MAKAALLVLLAIFGAASTARTPRPHPAPSAPREPAPAPTWNAHGTFLHATAQANDDGTVNVTLSCTMTPLASLGVVDDTEHMALCEDLLARLHAEMLLRFDDKQVLKAVACRERGAQHGNPHLQMHYTVVVHASKYGSPTAQRQFVEAERKWLKALLDQWSPQLTVRLSMKTVKPKDVDYGFGYDLKDEGLAHFVGWVIGLNSSEIQRCKRIYRARAGQSTFAGGHKMNKAPHTNKKQVDFGVGNMYTLATWFVQEHGLLRLRTVLSLPLVLAYALSTNCYRLDEALITGKNGGVSLDPARAQAFFALSFGDVHNIPRTVALIETVLFGASGAGVACPPSSSTFADAPLSRRLPSTAELVAGYDLAAAKELCQALDEMEAEERGHAGQAGSSAQHAAAGSTPSGSPASAPAPAPSSSAAPAPAPAPTLAPHGTDLWRAQHRASKQPARISPPSPLPPTPPPPPFP